MREHTGNARSRDRQGIKTLCHNIESSIAFTNPCPFTQDIIISNIGFITSEFSYFPFNMNEFRLCVCMRACTVHPYLSGSGLGIGAIRFLPISHFSSGIPANLVVARVSSRVWWCCSHPSAFNPVHGANTQARPSNEQPKRAREKNYYHRVWREIIKMFNIIAITSQRRRHPTTTVHTAHQHMNKTHQILHQNDRKILS